MKILPKKSLGQNFLIDKNIINKIISICNITKEDKILEEFYSPRGINLSKTGSKWSFRTSPDLTNELTIFKKQKRKISRAALETLAIIAYHQPITRSEIENIRGVQMGRGSIDLLVEIGWLKPSGRKKIPGRPTLWSTTDLFLEHFGLADINDLPNKEELQLKCHLTTLMLFCIINVIIVYQCRVYVCTNYPSSLD